MSWSKGTRPASIPTILQFRSILFSVSTEPKSRTSFIAPCKLRKKYTTAKKLSLSLSLSLSLKDSATSCLQIDPNNHTSGWLLLERQTFCVYKSCIPNFFLHLFLHYLSFSFIVYFALSHSCIRFVSLSHLSSS